MDSMGLLTGPDRLLPGHWSARAGIFVAARACMFLLLLLHLVALASGVMVARASPERGGVDASPEDGRVVARWASPWRDDAAERIRKPLRGMLLFVCRPGHDGSCNDCDLDVNQNNAGKFKLGVVVNARRRSRKNFAIYTCQGWPDLATTGFPDEGNMAEEHLIRSCKVVAMKNQSQDRMECFRHMSFNGAHFPHAGKKGFVELMGAVSEAITKTEATLAWKEETDGRWFKNFRSEPQSISFLKQEAGFLKQHMTQLENDERALWAKYQLQKTRIGMKAEALKLERSSLMFEKLVPVHKELSDAIVSMVADLRSLVGGSAEARCREDVDEHALETLFRAEEDSEEARQKGRRDEQSLLSDAEARLKESQAERRAAKQEEYKGLLEGFGFFSWFLVSAAADVGMPGLGTLLSYSGVAARASERIANAMSYSHGVTNQLGVISTQIEAAAQLQSAVLDESLALAPKVVKELGNTAIEVVNEELQGVVQESVESVVMERDVKRNWRNVVTATLSAVGTAIKEAAPDVGKAAVKEVSWAGAELIPLLGPYVSMLRQVGELLTQGREASVNREEYMTRKDSVYHGIFSMRNCGLRTALMYEVPAEHVLPESPIGRRRKGSSATMARKLEKEIGAMRADIIDLQSTIQAATAALRANRQLKDSISFTYKIQQVFRWNKRAAHEADVTERVNKRFGVTHTKPVEWGRTFNSVIQSACVTVNELYDRVKMSDQQICCEETCPEDGHSSPSASASASEDSTARADAPGKFVPPSKAGLSDLATVAEEDDGSF